MIAAPVDPEDSRDVAGCWPSRSLSVGLARSRGIAAGDSRREQPAFPPGGVVTRLP
jgi:hypothetical protein